MIQLNNIKKVFQTEEVETWALRNISLQVKEGCLLYTSDAADDVSTV